MLGDVATVYLAENLKHHRYVVTEALRPELAATDTDGDHEDPDAG